MTSDLVYVPHERAARVGLGGITANDDQIEDGAAGGLSPHPGGLAQYNAGVCDGWLVALDNDLHSIGYYGKDDLSVLRG
jgi:hypothetical protein